MVAEETDRKAIPVKEYPIGESRKTVFLLPLQNGERALLVVPEGVAVTSLGEEERWFPGRENGIYRIGQGEFLVVDLKTGEQTIIAFGQNSNCLKNAA